MSVPRCNNKLGHRIVETSPPHCLHCEWVPAPNLGAASIKLPRFGEKLQGLTKRQRQALDLIRLYGDVCFYCDKALSDFDRTIDHFVPRSRGGTDARTNLRLSCIECNSKKGVLSYEEFRSIYGERSIGGSERQIVQVPVGELVMQDRIWIDKAGKRWKLERMSPAHRRNLYAWMRRRAGAVEMLEAIMEISEQATLEELTEQDWRMNDPVAWVIGTPLMRRLRELVEEDSRAIAS